jgi:hypothetical protein
MIRSTLVASLFLLAACSVETIESSNGTPSPTPSDTTTPPGEDPQADPPATDQPAEPPVEKDDPRSIAGTWREKQIDLFSSDVIVGVAPLDAKHVWVATLSYGALSVRMWNGSSWEPKLSLAGVASERTSGYGIRLVGKGQVWAYGPGILHHLENGKWVNLSSKLAKDTTWGADGILAIGGWGDEAFLTAQTSAYRWSKGALTKETNPPYAQVIFGTSATDAWAFAEEPFGVGDPAIYRKNGSGKFELLHFGDAGDLTYPNGAYGGAASLTAGNVWALGNNEVMLEDGEGFKKIARPSADTSEIYKVVWTSGPNNTWVMGSAAYHWDGQAWSKAPSDLKGTYYGISGSSPDRVWAYGATSGTWSLYELEPN